MSHKVLFGLAILACLATAVILLLEFHLHAVSRGWRKAEKRVVITGLTGSGKTRLFQELTSDGEPRGTVTSLEANVGQLKASDDGGALSTSERQKLFANSLLVDFPGHGSDVCTLLETEIPRVAGVIFLVDSEDRTRVKEASSYLFQILSCPAFQTYRPALCVVINKLESPQARHKNLVRSDIEREIELLRRLHEQAPLRAEVPPAGSWRNWLLRVLGHGQLKLLMRKVTSAKKKKISIMLETNIFRILSADAAFTTLAQESSRADVVRLVKGFIQRAVLNV